MPIDQITRQKLLASVPAAVAQGYAALAAWEAVADSVSDERGDPVDEERFNAYQYQLHSAVWTAVEPFLDHGPELVSQAEADLLALHREAPDIETATRCGRRLGYLRQAIVDARHLRVMWAFTDNLISRDRPQAEELRGSAKPGRYAVAYESAMCIVENADVLVEIDHAVRERALGSRNAEVASAGPTASASPLSEPTAGRPPRAART